MSDPLDSATARYVSKLQALPKLDKHEELALARAFRDRHEPETARRLVEANLRHVVAMALRYRRLGVPMDELIAQGSVGLMLALDRFDPERGLRLATYANHWIRAEILSHVLRSRTLVGGGRGDLRARYAFALKRDHARLLSMHGSNGEALRIVGERYGKTSDEVAELLARQELRDVSLEAPVSSHCELSWGEHLPHPAAEPEVVYTSRRARPALARAVAAVMAELGERERFIVEHRLLADSEAQATLEELGRRFGVSRERVRQLELRVRARLRDRLAPLMAHYELVACAPNDPDQVAADSGGRIAA